MNGVLIIDKPQDFTSFDVVAKLRGILGTKKIGHTGTLDPMATGVLTVLVGKATRACDLIEDGDKSYTAGIRLGTETDTLDIWGKVLKTAEVNVTAEEFIAAALSFKGDIMQVPPMYSAVKVNGQKLYQLARKGVEVKREPRPVTVKDIRITAENEAAGEYEIEVDCSKGTYIRTLCSDIGEKLGCGAVMTSLRRTRASGFGLENSFTFEKLQKLKDENADLQECFFCVDRLFESLERIDLTAENTARFLNGAKLPLEELSLKYSEKDFRIYSNTGEFLGTAYTDAEEGVLRIRKLFAVR